MPRDANALIKSAAMYAGVVVNQTRHFFPPVKGTRYGTTGK